MKTHTQDYKNQLKSLGKEIDSIITIGNTELTSEQINSVNLHYEGNILKSVMKQLDLVLTEPLEKGTELNYKFGLDVNGTNEYMDYGQFIVKEVEKQEDTNTYKITCYDKMLYSMVDYEDLNIEYPITIKNYLQAICTKLGLTLKDDTFANQDNEIENELYLDSEGNSLGYTFRDVLDEIAQATGSTICINDNDELEIRYIEDVVNETQEANGTDLTLTDSQEGQIKGIEVEGNTTQDGTPSPTNPINIDVVSGLQEVDIVGKNLLNVNIEQGSLSSSGTPSSSTTRVRTDDFTKVVPSTQYILSLSSNERIQSIVYEYDDTSFLRQLSSNWSDTPYNFTTGNTTTRIKIVFRIYGNLAIVPSDISNIQLEKGNQATTYEAFKRQSYDINLGKNLLKVKDSTATSQGITYTTSESTGEIVVNGTASATSTSTNFNDYVYYEKGNYTISLNNTQTMGENNYLRLIEKTSGSVVSGTSCYLNVVNGTKTITLSESGYYRWQVRINSGEVLNNFVIKPQVEKGNQATSYSEYFTPIELCKIGNYQDKIFKGSGKNLWSGEYEKAYIGGTSGTEFIVGSIAENTRTAILKVEPNTTYTIKKYYNTGIGTRFRVFEYPTLLTQTTELTASNRLFENDSATQCTITTSSSGEYLYVYITNDATNIPNIQIEKGTQATDYEPYGYKDKWYIQKEIGKVVLNGSENWIYNSSNNFFYISFTQGSTTNSLSNYYKLYTSTQLNNQSYGFAYTSSYLRIKNIDYSVVDNFKTWLGTHNTIVYYVLANPTTEEITNSELLSQLKALEKAKTYEGITNILSSFPISFNYVSEYEIIDEEFVKNTRASFDKTYSPINSLVLSRSADSDNIYIQDEDSIEENGLHELKIADNQILNGNNRDEYINEIFEKVNGLTYTYNDFESIGITYLELCDRYRVSLRGNKYTCVMFNDEIEVNNGLNEIIYTDEAEQTKTDYTKADKTDRRINQTYIIADKQQGQITALVNKTNNIDTEQKNNYQSILAQLGNYATTSEIEAIQTEVEQIQTDSYTRTEIKQILKGTFYDEDNNQIVSEVVKTISGTFDENGMTYAKTGAKTNTTINEIGIRTRDTLTNNELLFAGYDEEINQTIVRADNMTTRNFLVVGEYSRFQDYEDGTGVFDL